MEPTSLFFWGNQKGQLDIMPPRDNAHVMGEKRTLLQHMQAGISTAVEAKYYEWPDWVKAIMATRTPGERGYLMGVLVEAYGRLEDDVKGFDE